jgi:hypothetical protein
VTDKDPQPVDEVQDDTVTEDPTEDDLDEASYAVDEEDEDDEDEDEEEEEDVVEEDDELDEDEDEEAPA